MFVHQRFLTNGIQASEWPNAYARFFRVLRPGGSAQFMEVDQATWPQRTKAERKIINSRRLLAEKTGLLFDAAKRSPKMIGNAGFTDIRTETKFISLDKGICIGEDGVVDTAAIGRNRRCTERNEECYFTSGHSHISLRK